MRIKNVKLKTTAEYLAQTNESYDDLFSYAQSMYAHDAHLLMLLKIHQFALIFLCRSVGRIRNLTELIMDEF